MPGEGVNMMGQGRARVEGLTQSSGARLRCCRPESSSSLRRTTRSAQEVGLRTDGGRGSTWLGPEPGFRGSCRRVCVQGRKCLWGVREVSECVVVSGHKRPPHPHRWCPSARPGRQGEWAGKRGGRGPCPARWGRGGEGKGGEGWGAPGQGRAVHCRRTDREVISWHLRNSHL